MNTADNHPTPDSGMLEETARVIEVKQNVLIAEMQSRSGCSHCAGDSCATSVVAKLFGVRRNRLTIANSIDAKPGDQVMIGIPHKLLVRVSLMLYLLPLLSMLGITAIGDLLGLAPYFLCLLTLSGLAMGFYLVHWLSPCGPSHRYKPRLLRIVAADCQRVEMPTFMRS